MSSVVASTFTDKAGPIPLSSQITEMLVRDIHTGVLPDGERLPPERTMAQKLGIAVGTLRKALSELERRGLLSRVQGSGNYIKNPLEVDNVYALFRLELLNGPATPSAQILSVDKIAKSEKLPLPGTCATAHRFRRIRKLNDTVAALEEIWLDGRISDSIDESLITDSLYGYYQQHLGLRITRAEDHVSVASLPDWAPHQFKARDISHWGFIERVSRDQDGLIAEYSTTWFDPQTVRFVTR